MKRMPAKHQSGFTLLELMVTLTVASILATLAYPNMRDFMRRNRAVEQSNGMQSNLQYARGQAAATRSYVSICPVTTAGGQVCDTADGVYNNGWIIYTAPTPNTVYTAATGYTVQESIAAPANASIIADTAGVLTYNSLGQLLVSVPAAGTPANVNFFTCAEDNTGATINTATIPGIQLSAANSGRIASSPLAAGAACN
jgi:type IV fimbrial biogenesis protein FimT